MKRTLIITALILSSILSWAQGRHQDRKNAEMLDYPAIATRKEIIIPDIDGYKVIKTDLHVHTSFSDAYMTPADRVKEAWRDGLDAVAITDHIEHRPNDKAMAEYLRTQVPESKDGKVGVDLNVSVKYATKQGKKMDINVIPGLEITRNPQDIGHFCALFTTDNNLIPDSDPLQAIRNAKQQGALIQSNHPGWRRTDNEFTEVAKAAIKEGLIDGVEVFNGFEFYANVIERALKNHLYIAGNTDLHPTSHDNFGRYGHLRNMTLVLAKENTLPAIREALENGRTIAHSFGDLAGEESLLRGLFTASVDIKCLGSDRKGNSILLTNKTSLPFTIQVSGTSSDYPLEPMSSIIVKTKEDKITITAKNMWFGADNHPSFEFNVE